MGPAGLSARHWNLLAPVVLAHAAVSLGHGVSHAAIPVPLAAWQGAFVGLTVLAIPIGGLWLVRRGRCRAGGAAVCLGGLASFLFGTYYHFVATSPDHVSSVGGAWSLPFSGTAVGVSALAAATAIAGGAVLLVSGLDRDTSTDRGEELA